MVVFKEIKQFDVKTGEEIRSVRVEDHEICDFTGEKIEDRPQPFYYEVHHAGHDPCYGDGPNERWLLRDHGRYCHHELFSQRYYVYKTSDTGEEPFCFMYGDYVDEMEETPFSLDFLLRWARGRMLQRVIKEGKYTINDFLEEIIPEEDEG